MFSDCQKHCTACPQYAVVAELTSHRYIQRAFQIVGLNVIDLPRIESGNKHVIVFKDYLSGCLCSQYQIRRL